MPEQAPPVPNPTAPITAPAPAKINLDLLVTGRRDDGYHTLDTLVSFAGARDTVTARAMPGDAPPFGLEITGPFAPALAAACPDPAANLAVRAAAALRVLAERNGHAVPPTHLSLHKALPVASGIGGGSADAAAAIDACIRLWGLPRDMDGVEHMLRHLGADLPMCLLRRPLRATGAGERLRRVAMPALTLVLVNPGVALSTPDVFARREGAFTPPPERPAGFDAPDDLLRHLAGTRNDLEAPARALAPAIGDVLDALERASGCRLARMSGSGATCFGIFAKVDEAVAAAHMIGEAHPDWWVAATKTTAGRP